MDAERIGRSAVLCAALMVGVPESPRVHRGLPVARSWSLALFVCRFATQYPIS
jgi:hypothetical protein